MTAPAEPLGMLPAFVLITCLPPMPSLPPSPPDRPHEGLFGLREWVEQGVAFQVGGQSQWGGARAAGTQPTARRGATRRHAVPCAPRPLVRVAAASPLHPLVCFPCPRTSLPRRWPSVPAPPLECMQASLVSLPCFMPLAAPARPPLARGAGRARLLAVPPALPHLRLHACRLAQVLLPTPCSPCRHAPHDASHGG